MNVLWIVILVLFFIFICCAFAEGSYQESKPGNEKHKAGWAVVIAWQNIVGNRHIHGLKENRLWLFGSRRHHGDHLRSRDHLRLGIICGTVQGSLAVLYSTPLYYSTYVFPYFEMWYNDTKPSTFKVFSLTWPVSMQDKVIETTTTTKKTFTCRKSSTLTAFVWNTNMATARHVKPLSSAEAPARYPYKNSNNQKK